MFFKVLAFILVNLPDFSKRPLFELIYPLYLLKFKKEKRYVENRLKNAKLKIKAKEVYKNLFLNGLDSLRFCPAILQNAQIIPQTSPIIFVSIHLGAFELLHRELSKLCKINLIVSQLKNKKLDKFINNLRQTTNMNIVKDYQAGQILKNTIRKKENVAIMADQSKHGGDILKFPITANKLGASLVLFRTFKQNNQHIIRFEKVYEPYSKITSAELSKIFETWILEYPEQWTWNYGYSVNSINSENFDSDKKRSYLRFSIIHSPFSKFFYITPYALHISFCFIFNGLQSNRDGA